MLQHAATQSITGNQPPPDADATPPPPVYPLSGITRCSVCLIMLLSSGNKQQARRAASVIIFSPLSFQTEDNIFEINAQARLPGGGFFCCFVLTSFISVLFSKIEIIYREKLLWRSRAFLCRLAPSFPYLFVLPLSLPQLISYFFLSLT